MRIFCLDDLPAEPWRNGQGLTRTVAADGPGADFNWRISVASIADDATFSRFPGVDRLSALIQGQGVLLRTDRQDMPLAQRGDLARYPGEWHVSAGLLQGSVQVWNVMCRRGAAHAQVRLLMPDDVLPWDDRPSIAFQSLWVISGSRRWLEETGREVVIKAGNGTVRTAFSAQHPQRASTHPHADHMPGLALFTSIQISDPKTKTAL